MFKRVIQKLTNKKIGFSKHFFKYSEALNSCNGYGDKKLVNYIYKQNIYARKNKKFEQDGMIYDYPVINKFILNYLCHNLILKKNYNYKKKIRILDYGGSFGNLYFSLKNFIQIKFDWVVLEQDQKVLLGKKNKLFSEIKFISKINYKKKYDIILFNSSFQYLPNPLKVFQSIKSKSDTFIFTSLTLNKSKFNYLRKENPDPKVYNFTYPCWFLSEKNIENLFEEFNINKEKLKNPPYKLNNNENYFNFLLERKN